VSTTDDRWRAKQEHYQDPSIVAEYDARRFAGRHQRGATARKWKGLTRALGADFAEVRTVLDVPCGTGRFTRLLLEAGKSVVNADLSGPMVEASLASAGSHGGFARRPQRLLGGVRADALRLPFGDASVDLVLSIRFLFHVPRDLRPAVLREYARVSRRFVVVDVRHKYCWTTWSKRARARIAGRRSPSPRYSLAEIDADVAAGGLVLRKRVWIAPGFSEKMLLVCEVGR
jgi:SAM-dependent methyltransferase